MEYYYTYVLYSLKDNQFYIGYTSDIERRLKEHNRGKNISTSKRLPFKLIFYEAFDNKADALRRESYFKTSKGKTMLKAILRESLKMSKSQ